MKAVRSHKITISPTLAQENLLRQSVGCARFAFNWALGEWNRQYASGGKPNEGELRKQLNAVKRESFPWMLNVPKSVVQQAIKNVGAAFDRFFKKHAKYPRFKCKGRRDSTRLDNGPGTFRFDGKRIFLPKLNWVKMKEELRFSGRPLSAVVSCKAGRWYVSVQVEVEHTVPEREPSVVGVDLGVTAAATLSTGEKFEGPKPLKAALRQLKRLSQHLARKVKGSGRRERCKRKIARLHARIANLRRDWTHKLTTSIVRRFSLIGVEDLNVSGMVKNRFLARSISDIGFYELRRQIEYKAELYGAKVIAADRWFPSSKLCSRCGAVQEKLPLSIREWTCGCGATHDRDVNAAINLRNNASSCGANTPVEGMTTGRRRKQPGKPTSLKQEPNMGNECL